MTRRLAACCALFPCLLAAPAAAQEACATTWHDARTALDAHALPLQWRETGMDDGKPLVLTLFEREERLIIRFVKSQEGVWAEGVADLCTRGSAIELHFRAGQLAPGPAANWLMRHLLRRESRFDLRRLADGRLRVVTKGWSGEFAAETAP